MKARLVLTAILTSALFIYACSNNQEEIQDGGMASQDTSKSMSSSKSKNSSVISQMYPEAQAEVLETFGAIGAIITEGAGMGADSEYMDQLISYHAYGEKFTEFNHGTIFDSAGNEQNERGTFGDFVAVGGVKKFAAIPGSMKVAVYYGNVANLTFISDFDLEFVDGSSATINNLITLLFVKTQGKWKLVHEHHSEADISLLP